MIYIPPQPVIIRVKGLGFFLFHIVESPIVSYGNVQVQTHFPLF